VSSPVCKIFLFSPDPNQFTGFALFPFDRGALRNVINVERDAVDAGKRARRTRSVAYGGVVWFLTPQSLASSRDKKRRRRCQKSVVTEESGSKP